MDIGQAITHLRRGGKVARRGWNGKGMWLEIQGPDGHSKMTLPYIYLTTPNERIPGGTHGQIDQHDRVPWLASQTDILANDWHAV